MWKLVAFTVVLVQLAYLVATFRIQNPAEKPGDKLLFAHVLFRHGNRTPTASYPTDPWKDISSWPNDWGQLTNVGKRTHLHLGRWMRERYHNLISDRYSPNDIYVQSTEYDRVLMSALSNLAGLYPPKGDDIWDKKIDWQPIPVHQIPKSLDNIIASTRPCPKFDAELNKYMQGEVFQSYNKSLAPVYEYLSKNANMQIDSYLKLYDIYSTLDIEYESKGRLPEWTRKVYPEPLRNISATFFKLHTSTDALKRLKIGPLLKEMVNRFQQKINKTLQPNRSLWIYSGHDTSVVNLLNGLGMFKTHNPPFAACVMVELRSAADGKPFVSVYYRDSEAEPEAMSIPNCGTRCPLEKFGELYKHLIPDNWEKECEL
ncbi:testicular acid phosphatase homolog [Toxorhynchites rutilus septentrionalis]|uniref:testicular acid phosphatase homolog n=1 Tax=Toxorhynchites rutilus septentrionalis TaxID=329112 RepID=UPI00247A71CD|nr:testicular acid phosphatase homolog [Toxorhynchites rutilus septentrionalis]